jgi:hypothetical protein
MGIGEGFNWLTSALGSAVRLYSYGLKYQLWVLTEPHRNRMSFIP